MHEPLDTTPKEVPNHLIFSGLIVLSAVTGMMLYFPVSLIVDDNFLTPGTAEFGGDVTLFIFSLLALIGALFCWRVIFKQFKSDRTKLGFSSETSGFIVFLLTTLGTLAVFGSAITRMIFF